jgi:integrase
LRWEEWDRSREQIAVRRSVWHAIEGTTKTEQSNRFVTVTEELRVILLGLWKSQGSPLGGYILAHGDGARVNLDNMAKRSIAPILKKAGIEWHGWYSLRRFHGTQVREQAGNSDTMSKALGNSKALADKHYLKPAEVLPDVRKAVNDALRGLTGAQPLCN